MEFTHQLSQPVLIFYRIHCYHYGCKMIARISGCKLINSNYILFKVITPHKKWLYNVEVLWTSSRLDALQPWRLGHRVKPGNYFADEIVRLTAINFTHVTGIPLSRSKLVKSVNTRWLKFRIFNPLRPVNYQYNNRYNNWNRFNGNLSQEGWDTFPMIFVEAAQTKKRKSQYITIFVTIDP